MFAFISNLLTGLITWFAQYFTKRTACLTAFVVLMTALFAALMAAVNALIATLGVIPGGQAFYQWINYLLPTNAQLCFSLLVSNKVAHIFFSFQTKAATIAAIKC